MASSAGSSDESWRPPLTFSEAGPSRVLRRSARVRDLKSPILTTKRPKTHCEDQGNPNKYLETSADDSHHATDESDDGSSMISGNPDSSKENAINQYQRHPPFALDENEALENDNVVVYSPKNEERKCTITKFYIYDQNHQLCALDSGLIENNAHLYMSGYLKYVCSKNNDLQPVKDVGPITKWNIDCYKGFVTVTTESAVYLLDLPNEQYKPLMDNVYEKMGATKLVVEYLKENYEMKPDYKEFINIIQKSILPYTGNPMTEQMLHKYAKFVCDEVTSQETIKQGKQCDQSDQSLLAIPCMKQLVKNLGIQLDNTKTKTIQQRKQLKNNLSKATTTPIVRSAFEYSFKDQLDKTDQLNCKKKKCGKCPSCKGSKCGLCTACENEKISKNSTYSCVQQVCPYMRIEKNNDSDGESDSSTTESDKIYMKKYPLLKWIGKPVVDDKDLFYGRVEINGKIYSNGDFVLLTRDSPRGSTMIARIVYMWHNKYEAGAFFHGELFINAVDTSLAAAGNPKELFQSDYCCNKLDLLEILEKARVKKKEISENWMNLGGQEDEESFKVKGKSYFYCKHYERSTGRFEDLPVNPTCHNPLRQHRFCPTCTRIGKKYFSSIPRVSGEVANTSFPLEDPKTEWSSVLWQGCEYTKGSAVFLKPKTFRLKNSLNNSVQSQKSKKKKFKSRKLKNRGQKLKTKRSKPKPSKVDEQIYTEYHRKNDSSLTGSNKVTSAPFCVGYIAAIIAVRNWDLWVHPEDIYLRVHVMYRPENISVRKPQHKDVNLVYWSDHILDIPFSAVVGPCQLFYKSNIRSKNGSKDWFDKDPRRFYFKEAYDPIMKRVGTVPKHAAEVGKTEQGPDRSVRPLRTLDVFAGCGGLSAGLHRAGVADCRWAIENDPAAAQAFKLNNKDCTVFVEDCNELLRDVMAGATTSAGGLKLPARGEVELLCGGPPCQGFSSMNRFNSREYSKFKNSLVATFLSYCDFYRPKYCVFENVRNFVAYKDGMVLKLTLRALLDMGYQCAFGVLQAGHFGVPQSRRRFILLAAAPGLVLPRYPQPAYVFSRSILRVRLDKKRYVTSKWKRIAGAPRRTCTVYDAIGDLPAIESGANQIEIKYDSKPLTHFQRVARGSNKSPNSELREHICKVTSPIVQARINHIPATPDADWRNLPNISVTLADGTKSKVLLYPYTTGSGRDAKRSKVCACAIGRTCSASDKQNNTLIPWSLAHTAHKNNNWAGLYGRLDMDGFFSTTLTDPDPMGKQGRVLHPKQHRIVSVRECARSQGFLDDFIFVGTLANKHRQIGNAVPPPLAEAIGREIIKAINKEYPDTII